MTLRKKIFLLILACLVLFSGALFIFSEIQSHQNDLMLRSAVEQQEMLITNEMYERSDDLKQIVTDYTNWDDIIQYIEKQDQKWAIDNISTIINSFKLHSVEVFNLEKRKIYSFGKQSDSIIGKANDQDKIFEKVNSKGFIHYYRWTPDGILEISGATIHPTLDTSRLTAGQGYFFISKLWNKQFLNTLSKLTGSIITTQPVDFNVSNSTENHSLFTSALISDYNQNPFCTLVFEKPNKFLASYHRTSDFVLIYLASLLVFVLTIFFYMLYRWVRRPLRIISETLKRGDTSQLSQLQKNKDEFSLIAGLIIKFNQQRKQLEKENTERKLIQQQIAIQNKLLNGLAEASSRLLTIENLDDAINSAFEAIVTHATIDRISIFKNVYDNDLKSMKMHLIYDWMQPEIRQRVDPNEYKEVIYSSSPDGWFARLQEGQNINGRLEDFGDDLKPLFERRLIKSMVAVPIMDPQEHTFWGFAGFADCSTGHTWSTVEETAFAMLANNLAGAIRRHMSQMELKETMELARAADKAKSNFLASMSHEIRTPMNGVIGMTSLLLQSELTASQRELVQTIETSGDNLLNIINEILDFSKIESGNMVLEENAFDLRRCIEDVLDLMVPKIFEKRLELIYFIDPKINAFIFGDGFRLRQVLLNLIGNAVKFTASGEIFIQVTINQQIDDMLILEFSVKDTGIGIPQEKLDTLFTPFTQVDASTTRKYGGTGLGLAISSNLVMLMGGKIWVESSLGKSSDFKFTMRTYFIDPPVNKYKAVEKLQQLNQKKVLIVDDNSTNRRILQLQFHHWNIGSIAVGSGGEALELLDKKESFDIAILDMQMPEMDGEMLAREIRKRFTKSELPLIMLTSIGYNKRTPEVQELFSFYLNKPVKHSLLADILISVFSEEQIETSLPKGNEPDLKDISAKYPFEILIAEDNFINQKLVRKLFEVLGYKTDLAANGYDAIDALKRKSYTIIFMDVQMPEMDGYEATRIIKERWGSKAPLIIAMTANAMQGDREKCMLAGMDDYVSKPIRLDDLLGVINLWGQKGEHLF